MKNTKGCGNQLAVCVPKCSKTAAVAHNKGDHEKAVPERFRAFHNVP